MRAPSSAICALALATILCAPSCSKKSYQPGRCAAGPVSGSASAAPAADELRLRVATVNMWGIPLVSRDKDARFAALAERLNRDDTLDLVSLQEMWSDRHRTELLERVAASYPYQADFHSLSGGGGLVILSRHEFTEPPRFLGFSDRGKWWKPWTGEWFGRKGAGFVHVRVGDRTTWFVNTHPIACYERTRAACEEESDEYASTRWAQVTELRRWVSEVAGSDPAIIAGDFNFTPGSRFSTFLAASGNGDGRGNPPWVRVGDADDAARSIDHVWIRPGRAESWEPLGGVGAIFTEPVRSGGGIPVPLSDHCARAATLRLAPRAAM